VGVPDRARVGPGVALAVLALIALSAWSALHLSGEGGAPPPSPAFSAAPDLARLDGDDRCEGVGTVRSIAAAHDAAVLLWAGRTVRVESSALPGGLAVGDRVAFSGVRTGGTRFGGSYVRGTVRVLEKGSR
jgi:hypothetical protein